MKRLYIIIAAIIAILILGIVLILNYNNIFNINNKDIVDSKDTIDINKIINKDAITFNVDKTNIGESKVKINIAVQYEDNLSYCCYPINWEFVNIDKTKYNGSNTQSLFP